MRPPPAHNETGSGSRRETAAGPLEVGLFDYGTDPGETRNHASAHPEVVARLASLLDQLPKTAR